MIGPRSGHADPVRTLKLNSILIIVLPRSAGIFLQRPAPRPGELIFGAPRPGRPGAPANPGIVSIENDIFLCAVRLAEIESIRMGAPLTSPDVLQLT
jgi:hypothetical protein